MFNPVILEASEECEFWEEWCLSVPNKKWEVKRSKEVKLVFQNEKWAFKSLVLTWLKARIVLHEIDHLDWILFTDRL
jgi:peptide deformylase